MTSTIKQQKDYSNLTPMAYKKMETSDGRYYSAKIKHMADLRFPFMILKCSQHAALEPIFVTANNNDDNNVLYFSDTTGTYDATTKTITVDQGANAWARPQIIFPKGCIEFE